MAKILLLIVEDDASLSEMYSMKFKSSGFQVDVAHNGIEGFEKMKLEHPDLVLMDVMMPELNGLEAVKKAKSDDEIKNIPIIMLTNLSGSSDIQAAVKAGAVDYIVKSDMTPAEVVKKVQSVLGSDKASNPGKVKA